MSIEFHNELIKIFLPSVQAHQGRDFRAPFRDGEQHEQALAPQAKGKEKVRKGGGGPSRRESGGEGEGEEEGRTPLPLWKVEGQGRGEGEEAARAS